MVERWAPAMRDSEKLLVCLNITGSLAAGWSGLLGWFLVSGTTFLTYLILEDRALRRRIGARAWPSEGYARFSFNTNLNFALTQMLLGAGLFAVTGLMQKGLGG